jgi:hypothetical protein
MVKYTQVLDIAFKAFSALGDEMTKTGLWLGSLGIAMMVAGSAVAADMAVPVERRAVAQEQVDCIRWVRQNQSWYNYCDPVPYFAKTTYGDYWWDPRWARPGTRWQ